jgi:hypothetical protein
MLDEKQEPYFEELTRWLEQTSESDSEYADKAKTFLEQLPKLRAKGIDSKNIWHKMLSPDKYPMFRWALSNMKWQIFTHRQRVFFTYDNPIVYFGNIGLGNSSSELVFPIDSQTALLTAWRLRWRNQYETPSEGTISQINRRLASAATRFVYSHDDAAWKLRLTTKHKIRIQPLV